MLNSSHEPRVWRYDFALRASRTRIVEAKPLRRRAPNGRRFFRHKEMRLIMRFGRYESSEGNNVGTAVTFFLIGLGAGALVALALAPIRKKVTAVPTLFPSLS